MPLCVSDFRQKSTNIARDTPARDAVTAGMHADLASPWEHGTGLAIQRGI